MNLAEEMPMHVESTCEVCHYNHAVDTGRVVRFHGVPHYLLFAHSRLRGKPRRTVICGTDKRMQYYEHRKLCKMLLLLSAIFEFRFVALCMVLLNIMLV